MKESPNQPIQREEHAPVVDGSDDDDYDGNHLTAILALSHWQRYSSCDFASGGKWSIYLVVLVSESVSKTMNKMTLLMIHEMLLMSLCAVHFELKFARDIQT